MIFYNENTFFYTVFYFLMGYFSTSKIEWYFYLKSFLICIIA